ncbi:MAG: hypothetical protein QG635_146, partial [Bacteroidota bacterium]|nr:hypothetical protein [Bacteroidota bacterium]
SLINPMNLNTSNTVSNTTNNFSLIWDNNINRMKWSEPVSKTSLPVSGNGTTGNPLTLANLQNSEILFYYNGWRSGQIDPLLFNSVNTVSGATDGYTLTWNNASAKMEWKPMQVNSQSPVSGSGTSTSPLTLAPASNNQTLFYFNGWQYGLLNPVNFNTTNQAGIATDGFALCWDQAAGKMKWGQSVCSTQGIISGNGTAANPIKMNDITNNTIPYYNSGWTSGKITNLLFNSNSINLENIGAIGGSAGQILAVNATANGLLWKNIAVETAGMVEGSGASADKIRLKETGVVNNDIMYYLNGWRSGKIDPVNLNTSNTAGSATDGYYLRWDNTASKMKWDAFTTSTAGMIIGSGSAADRIRLNESGVTNYQVMFYNGGWTSGKITPSHLITSNTVGSGTDGNALVWDNTAGSMKWANRNVMTYTTCNNINNLNTLGAYSVINYSAATDITQQNQLSTGVDGQILYLVITSGPRTVLGKTVTDEEAIMLIYAAGAWHLPQ